MRRIIFATALLLPSAAGATEWLSRDGQSVFSTAEFGTGYTLEGEDTYAPLICDLVYWPMNFGDETVLTCEGDEIFSFVRKNPTTVIIGGGEYYLLR